MLGIILFNTVIITQDTKMFSIVALELVRSTTFSLTSPGHVRAYNWWIHYQPCNLEDYWQGLGMNGSLDWSSWWAQCITLVIHNMSSSWTGMFLASHCSVGTCKSLFLVRRAIQSTVFVCVFLRKSPLSSNSYVLHSYHTPGTCW